MGDGLGEAGGAVAGGECGAVAEGGGGLVEVAGSEVGVAEVDGGEGLVADE